MDYDDLFKPKRTWRINFKYTDPYAAESVLEFKSHSREDAEKQFLNIMSQRKHRKVAKYEVHQKAWDF